MRRPQAAAFEEGRAHGGDTAVDFSDFGKLRQHTDIPRSFSFFLAHPNDRLGFPNMDKFDRLKTYTAYVSKSGQVEPMATLVTIPGIMSDARTWATLARDLESQVDGVHVADTTQDATLEKMAARALHDTRGDLIVVAHSMGGRVAMEMGRQAPERIKAMILSSTSAEGPGANEKNHREVRINAANADMADYGKNWAPKVLSKKNSENGALVARI